MLPQPARISASPRHLNMQKWRGRVGMCLVASLSVLAGMTDAIGFMATGDFVSFMSGNTTRLAVAISAGDLSVTLRLALAIFAFIGEALLEELPASCTPTLEPAHGSDCLSVRELGVLHLIAQGCSNQEISEQLFISLHTVKTHASHINSKLGVERRTQAVARAKVLGLLG